ICNDLSITRWSVARANIIIFQHILGNDGFLASYEISKIIVKAGKPHNLGETVSIPFEVNVAEIELSLQEPLIDLQSDEITRAKSKDEKYNIWKTTDVATKYPLLWDKARVSQILSKARNRLDIVKRGDLRLSLTSIEPNIKKLVEKHQPPGSH
ncbi:hypothetical protein QYM36_014212, partial [Artemia franciscana]